MMSHQASPTSKTVVSNSKVDSVALSGKGAIMPLNNSAVEGQDSYRSQFGFPRLPLHDHIKTAYFLSLSLIMFPLSYIIALALTTLPPSVIDYLLPFSPSTATGALYHRILCQSERDFVQRTILVTGVGMAKGLTLARSFWLCGHRVIAADFDIARCSMWTPRNGWAYSEAFDEVYALKKPLVREGMGEIEKAGVQIEYIRDICRIVKHEGVDLWVSCSNVASAVEDAMVKEALDNMPLENGRRCACIQFDVQTTSTLHEKSTFIQYTKSLDLPVPESYDVTSHLQVLHSLERATKEHPDRKFILKPVGMDDTHRADMTLLPLAAASDTKTHIRHLPMSKDKPWILQQFIHGGREYCTHSLVVDGEVKVFVACPSDELLMHYTALAHDDALGEEMLRFTRKFAAAAGRGFTGHLSFDFMAENDNQGRTVLRAIECNPRAHTAVVLFGQTGGEVRSMVDAYLTALENPPSSGDKKLLRRNNNGASRLVRSPTDAKPRYWVGHDLVTLLVLPASRLLGWDLEFGIFFGYVKEFIEHVLFWKDGTFELWDPWPCVALYHHYWPKAMVTSWWKGERWSRVNVSTTKMFSC